MWPAAASVVRDGAAQLLGTGQAAAGRGDGQHRRDAVVADDAGDLLGQRPLVGEVGAPARRRHDAGRSRSRSATAPISASEVRTSSRVYSTPIRPETKPVGQVDRRRRSGVASCSEPRSSAAPPASSTSSCDRRGRRRRRRPAGRRRARSAGGLARQLVPARGARDRHRVEVRRLDQHVAWSSAPISVVAPPITPARPIGPRLVGDQQVFGVERARSRRRGSSSFSPALRAAHGDAAGELVEVVAVDRLAEFEHHVVGDVDDAARSSGCRRASAGRSSTAGSAGSGRRRARRG